MSAKHDDAGGYPRDVYMDRRKRAERRERDRAEGERRAGEARSIEGTEGQRFAAALDLRTGATAFESLSRNTNATSLAHGVTYVEQVIGLPVALDVRQPIGTFALLPTSSFNGRTAKGRARRS